MLEFLKIAIIFLFIILLLKRKINIGYALLLGSLPFFILYKFDLTEIPEKLAKALTSSSSIGLFLSLTLIRSFEYSLRQHGLMKKMTDASNVLISNQKLSVISMPLIIGMLPSLGGAYLSAPMVDSATRNANISKEDKAFINYWFRHPWELILPLYPGIVLASTVSGIPLRELIMLNLPVAIFFFLAGFINMRNLNVKNPTSFEKSQTKIKINYLTYFIPILMVLMPVMVFKVDLFLTLFFCIAILGLFFRDSPLRILRTIKYGLSKEVLILVLGVMIFKEMLQISGAVEGIAKAINELNIPKILVFTALPFIVGLITGISVGFVGSTFPILLNLKEVLSYEISIAFVAGYVGVLISPLHLCLILTRDYFKADLLGIYRRISLATVLIFFIALIEFAILRYYI